MNAGAIDADCVRYRSDNAIFSELMSKSMMFSLLICAYVHANADVCFNLSTCSMPMMLSPYTLKSEHVLNGNDVCHHFAALLVMVIVLLA